jgi:hypothetical protein
MPSKGYAFECIIVNKRAYSKPENVQIVKFLPFGIYDHLNKSAYNSLTKSSRTLVIKWLAIK